MKLEDQLQLAEIILKSQDPDHSYYQLERKALGALVARALRDAEDVQQLEDILRYCYSELKAVYQAAYDFNKAKLEAEAAADTTGRLRRS